MQKPVMDFSFVRTIISKRYTGYSENPRDVCYLFLLANHPEAPQAFPSKKPEIILANSSNFPRPISIRFLKSSIGNVVHICQLGDFTSLKPGGISALVFSNRKRGEMFCFIFG